MNGIVYLVGAGPGDPGLLTLRGAELLGRADVVVYDYLAAPGILGLAPAACRRVYVGKMSGHHAKSQEEINRLLVEEGRAGRVVVRLKGGDPYIFGRGGEEGEALAEAGVPFEEVPGVTSAIAAAAYAGIPLTHRDFTAQAALITGHERPDKTASAHDWGALAKMGTIAMVMGVKNIGPVCQALVSAGRDPATPAALIQWGTTSRQRVVTATLADMAAQAAAAGLTPPALFVCGQVVSLRPRLNWFERRPLFGRRVLVTRSREQASQLSAALRELGAEVWERPTIAIRALMDGPALATARAALNQYDWLLFTSPNGAGLFLGALYGAGLDGRALARLKIGAIGPGTAAALKPFGLKADVVPEKFVAESFLAALLRAGAGGQKIILARARHARDVLPGGLKAAGAEVLDFPVYETAHPAWADPLPGRPDLVTLTSSSTAQGLAALVAPGERGAYPAASIGPVTTKTAEGLGFPVVLEAPQSTIESLAGAIARHFRGAPK